MGSPVMNGTIDELFLKVQQAVFMPDFGKTAYSNLKMSGNCRGKSGIG
jgi:hypothetical protein